LAGPVVAAAVILPKDIYIEGINDSKKLSEQKRNSLFKIIKEKAIAYNIQAVDSVVIDKINILQATFTAMKKSIDNLHIKPDMILVDGNHKIPGIQISQTAIVSGDAKSACIACASILAKVTRDNMMYEYAKQFPQYNFEKHKGYGTKEHIERIKKFGPCKIHRKTFAPVKNFI